MAIQRASSVSYWAGRMAFMGFLVGLRRLTMTAWPAACTPRLARQSRLGWRGTAGKVWCSGRQESWRFDVETRCTGGRRRNEDRGGRRPHALRPGRADAALADGRARAAAVRPVPDLGFPASAGAAAD